MINHHTNDGVCVQTPDSFPGLFFTQALLLICTSIIIISCATTPVQIQPEQYFSIDTIIDSNTQWNCIDTGIDRMDYTNNDLPLRWHALRIDLSTPGITIHSWPGTALTGKSKSPISVAKETNIVLNTMQFYKERHGFKTHTIPLGVYIHKKEQLTRKIKSLCALTFTKQSDNTYTATIYDSQADINKDNTPDFAFGGYWTIMRDGVIHTFKAYRDTRLAIGVSENHKILYILLVEGNKKSTSQGLTFMECAQLLQRLGAYTAMQFDGGTSAQVYVQQEALHASKSSIAVPVILSITLPHASDNLIKGSEKIDE